MEFNKSIRRVSFHSRVVQLFNFLSECKKDRIHYTEIAAKLMISPPTANLLARAAASMHPDIWAYEDGWLYQIYEGKKEKKVNK